MKTYTLEQIAAHISATILLREPGCPITGIAPLQQATLGQIAFLDNPKYLKYLSSSQASAVILSASQQDKTTKTCLLVPNPYFAYSQVAQLFDNAPTPVVGVHPSAVVDETAELGEGVSIAANAVIGKQVVLEAGVVIGAGSYVGEGSYIGAKTCIWPNVSIYHQTRIGISCIIHSGVVIGSDGFGIAKDAGVWHHIPQIGSVTLGNSVEVGANTTIDRGAIGKTYIGDGVKLDNQIQVGHNVHIGEHSVVAGCVAIAGSVRIGKHCIIGGGASIAGHLELADNVVLTGTTAVSRSIPIAGIYSSGTPAQPNAAWRRSASRFRHLDEMAKRLSQLEKNYEHLKRRLKLEMDTNNE